MVTDDEIEIKSLQVYWVPAFAETTKRESNMTARQVLDVSRTTRSIPLVIVSAPVMLVGLGGRGVAVSLLQALTQIQEMTLAFVQKILGDLRVFIDRAAVHGGKAERRNVADRGANHQRLSVWSAVSDSARNEDTKMKIDISMLPALAAAHSC